MLQSPIQLNSLSSHHIGLIGESFARFIIEQKTELIGIKSTPYHGDLVLSNGLYIEVKTIRLNKDRTYKATIQKGKHQHIGSSDFILLQIVDFENRIYHYIIPASEIVSKRITISSHPTLYAGKYSKYLDCFSSLKQ